MTENKIPPVKELKKICAKRENEIYWRDKVHRGISIYFTKIFLHLKLAPVHVGILSLIAGLVAAVSFAFGEYKFVLLGVFLHHFSMILDACDGEIARFDTSKKGGKGAYLDSIFYYMVHPAIALGIGIGAYLNNPTNLPDYFFLAAGIIVSYFIVMSSFIRLKQYERLIKKKKFSILKSYFKKHSGLLGNKEVQFRFLYGFGNLFNLIFIFGILDLMPYLILFYAVTMPLIFLRKLSRVLSEVKDLK